MKKELAYPGSLCVCVDDIKENCIRGRFYHRYGDRPVAFENVIQLVLKAEKIFDQNGAPEAQMNGRSFRSSKKKGTDHMCGEGRPEMAAKKRFSEQDGQTATFIINVQYRQHASWQGFITWVEGGKNCAFLSALELVKIIDNTVRDAGFKEAASEQAEIGRGKQDGEKQTFIISSLYRQYASWQGHIKWLEGKKSYPFRSALEMIKLMDSAVRDDVLRMGELDESEALCQNADT